MRNQTQTQTQKQMSKRERIFWIVIALLIFVLIPTLIAIAFGITTRGYFAVGGEMILPILGIICLSRVEIDP